MISMLNELVELGLLKIHSLGYHIDNHAGNSDLQITFLFCFESKPSDSNRESTAYKTGALTDCARFGSGNRLTILLVSFRVF